MDVFDLVAKIRLDSSEYESGVGKAKGTFSNLASGVKTGLATVAKVGGAAIAAGAAGVAALTKMGVEGFAQYEQLTGGVETLFKSSQGTVMKYAENAYKTAGMSANQYMETVTSFSASLIQSLDGDTAKAAEIGNMAITDMSDNANKMGTSMEMIQNAYNGFAKQNYTMLDNLKLGYGGTKEEMQRLLKDAEKISGIKYDISSFSDVTEAIHVMQEEMGIAGTTSREAATTIEGSIGMMKGAWQNLVVGMADENANMEVLINNFVDSTAIAAQNLLPRIEQTLKGIGTLIEKLSPVIADALPVLVESVLPSLLSAGVSLITSVVKGVITALPALYTALLDAVKMILVEVFGVSEQKAGEFADGINSFFTSIKDGFSALVESAQTEGTWLNEVWTGLKDTGKALCDFLVALWDALSAAFTWCVEQINTEGTLLNTIWENIQAAISHVVDVIKGVIQVFVAVLKGDWSGAWEACQNIVSNTLDYISSVISSGLEYAKSIVSGCLNAIGGFFSKIWGNCKATVSNALSVVSSKISSGLGTARATVSNILTAISGFFKEKFESAKAAVSNAISGVGTFLSSGLGNAKSTVSRILGEIRDKFDSIFEKCKKIVTTAIDAVKKAFDFDWSLPKLKIPKISVSGGEAPYGIGGKGSLPSFSIKWFKKAYDNAMVLSSPTIFGQSGNNLLGGGDGNGNEIVAGESHLMNLIGQVVESRTGAQNERIISVLVAILETITDGNEEMIRAILSDKKFAVGEREFARLVRTYA